MVNGNGAPVGWLPAVVRNLLRTVDMLPFGYASGLVASLADPHGRRLGDLVAGTLVVHAARDRARPPRAPAMRRWRPPLPLQPASSARSSPSPNARRC